MPACPSCRTNVGSGSARCPKCGFALTPELEVELDLASASGAALPAKLAQSPQNTGLRVGADGKLAIPRAPQKSNPGSSKHAIGLDEEGFDPYEIRAYADYGDPPAAFYLAPLYTLRVRKRKAELEAERDRRQEDVKAAQEKIDDAVIAFGERVRAVAAKHPVYQRALAPIEEIERLMASRDQALSGELDAYKQATGGLDARLSELEKQHHKLASEASAIEAECSKLEAARSRAEAKMKRADIELRNAEQSGNAGAAAMKVHLSEKTHERDSSRTELERLAPLIGSQEAKLEALRTARLNLERDMAAIRGERGEAEQRLKRQTNTREAGVQDARKRLRSAIGEFGITALADATTFGGEFNASRAAIEALLREKDTKERNVRMLEKAMATADGAAVKRGVMVGALGAVAVLLLIFGLPLYRVLVPHKPPPLYPTEE